MRAGPRLCSSMRAQGRRVLGARTGRVCTFTPMWLALLLTLQLVGCAELPEVARNECGNAIVEMGEDCDWPALGGPQSEPLCRVPGMSGECHLDCTARRDGSRPRCPDGWGCDFDSLCRAPTGNFTALPRHAVGGVDALACGDFDGDGRTDLLSRKPHDLVGRAPLAFHYFDARSSLLESRPVSILSTWPAIGKVFGSERDDLVFSDSRLGVFRGRPDRSWVPEAYTPYVLPDVSARVVGVSDGQIGTNDPRLGTNDKPVILRTPDGKILGSSPIVSLTTREAGTGLYVPVPNSVTEGQLALRFALPFTPERLAEDLVTANVLDAPSSPCREVLVAYRDAVSFELVELCGLDAHTGLPLWLSEGRHVTVPLEPAAPIETAPMSVDLNGDGHLDVLIGAGGLTYAALGDGSTLARAVPFQPPAADPEELGKFTMPLAAGDFTGDGTVDYVLPYRLLLSWHQPGDVLPHYASGLTNLGNPWTVARIADLNGNGLPDVVAAAQGSLNVDFFNGTGSRNVVEAQIPSGRPVSQLALGDFDGDLIRDLAFVEASSSESEPDTLMIAFGALSQLPSTPTAVARVRHVEELGSFGDNGVDTMSVVATRTVDGHLRSSVYFIGGSAARIPFAPLELLSFATDGSVYSVAALTVALGAFTAPAHKDVISLVSDLDGVPSFWLVPSIDGESPTPELLMGSLDPALIPSLARRKKKGYLSAELYATSAVADFDKDGRDEIAWAMPYNEAEASETLTRCGVAVFSVIGADKHALQSRGLLALEAPCLDPNLQAIDVDLDGWSDLVLLTGSERAADRKLVVLWNDRAGGFSAAASTVVATPGEAPQAFTTLAPTRATVALGAQPFRIVYVTKTALMATSEVQARAFDPPIMLGKLTSGTGVVAADLNGDHAIDLAVADDGDLVVFNAELQGYER